MQAPIAPFVNDPNNQNCHKGSDLGTGVKYREDKGYFHIKNQKNDPDQKKLYAKGQPADPRRVEPALKRGAFFLIPPGLEGKHGGGEQ